MIYRLLNEGEELQPGDQFLDQSANLWKDWPAGHIGGRFNGYHISRRKLRTFPDTERLERIAHEVGEIHLEDYTDRLFARWIQEATQVIKELKQ